MIRATYLCLLLHFFQPAQARRSPCSTTKLIAAFLPHHHRGGYSIPQEGGAAETPVLLRSHQAPAPVTTLHSAMPSLSESHSSEHGRTYYEVDAVTNTLKALIPSSSSSSSSSSSPSSSSSVARGYNLKASPAQVIKRIQRLLRTVFLPTGFPKSVAPEYLRFQIWNVIQDLSTYLRGILATQAILEGVGVGREGATALGATIQWITRDGASMISGLIFTSLVSTNFGTNSKSWRFFADFIVDVGITLDMLAPLVPKHFLTLICLASVFKSLCGISAGAANGAIVEHWAQKNNLAEILAKGGAQHTAVSLFGLGFGLWFARVANANPRRVWTAYVILTIIHLLSNYAAMRVLAFRSINRCRLDVIIKDFLHGITSNTTNKQQQRGGSSTSSSSNSGSSSSRIPTPAEVAKRERIIFWPWASSFASGTKVRAGVRLKDLAPEANELLQLQSIFAEEQYILTIRGNDILVALGDDAHQQSIAQLKAYLHAHIYEMAKADHWPFLHSSAISIRTTLEETSRLFPTFLEGLREQNWNLDRVSLSAEGWVFHRDRPASSSSSAAAASSSLPPAVTAAAAS